ncbi:MAG: ABC transporter permease [Planctomycetota bacterium]
MRPGRLLALAWKSIAEHKLRSLLTVSGVVFGVAAVVTMLAIGEGESQAAQEQIRRMGSNNLLLASVKPSEPASGTGANQRVLTYGLLHRDLRRIQATVPEIDMAVPRRDVPVEARVATRRMRATVFGTTPDYEAVANLVVARGRFLSLADEANRLAVCVLGSEVAQRLFLNTDPLGRDLHVGDNAYRVVGVLAMRGEGTGGTAGLGGESDAAILIPWSTMRERYGSIIVDNRGGSRNREEVELHRITVRAARGDEATVGRVAGALRRLLEDGHPQEDVRLTVPLELLREARETRARWTLILGTIAGISLLVGGIGIMNIMLASVVERTREIGIRRALGAKRRHIVLQFLAETVVLCAIGGTLGMGLSILLPHVLTTVFGLQTIVDPWFLGLAFGIAAGIGLVFGIYPAMRAARLDPVEALRHA